MLGMTGLFRRMGTMNPVLAGVGGGAIGGTIGGLTSGDRGGTFSGAILGAGAGIGLKYGSRPLRRMMRGQGIWGGGKPWGTTLKSNQAVDINKAKVEDSYILNWSNLRRDDPGMGRDEYFAKIARGY